MDSALPEINDALRLPSAKLIRHKPGRRAAIVHGGTVTKIRAKGLDKRAVSVYQELNKHALPFATPKKIKHIPHMRAIEFERLEGVDVEDLLFSGNETIAERAGEALAAMHAANITVRRRHTLDDEIEILRARLSDDFELFSACKAASKCLVEAEAVAVHRDFHPGQLMMQPNGILAVLDFDLMAMGDPAVDVGNFAAHLVEAAIRGKKIARTAVETFSRSYHAAGGPALVNNVAVYRALSMARLVTIARQRDDRRAYAERIRAAALLELTEGSK
jgi:aminoglycoside phosphotransferase (APT) family kinase protein